MHSTVCACIRINAMQDTHTHTAHLLYVINNTHINAQLVEICRASVRIDTLFATEKHFSLHHFYFFVYIISSNKKKINF